MELISYQDQHLLGDRFEALLDALASLRNGTLADAENGYPAIIHTLPADQQLQEVLSCHPWYRHGPLNSVYPHHDYAWAGINHLRFEAESGQIDARRTFEFPGLIGCSRSTLELVQAVNAAKETFRKAVDEVKKRYRELQGEDLEDNRIEQLTVFKEHLRPLGVKKALESAGIARLSLKHVYRPIPTIDAPELVEIKYAYYSKWPGAKITNVDEQHQRVLAQLEKNPESQALATLLRVLGQLPPQQTLAIRQRPNRSIRATYKIPNPHRPRGYLHKKVTGVLPIYYVTTPDARPPDKVDFSALDQPGAQTKRQPLQRRWATEPIVPNGNLYLPDNREN